MAQSPRSEASKTNGSADVSEIGANSEISRYRALDGLAKHSADQPWIFLHRRELIPRQKLPYRCRVGGQCGALLVGDLLMPPLPRRSRTANGLGSSLSGSVQASAHCRRDPVSGLPAIEALAA
jgi:hypothetical protein